MLLYLKPSVKAGKLQLTSDEGRVRGPGCRPLVEVLPAGAAHNLHITRPHWVNTGNIRIVTFICVITFRPSFLNLDPLNLSAYSTVLHFLVTCCWEKPRP